VLVFTIPMEPKGRGNITQHLRRQGPAKSEQYLGFAGIVACYDAACESADRYLGNQVRHN
jgi:hypothetical protein